MTAILFYSAVAALLITFLLTVAHDETEAVWHYITDLFTHKLLG